MFDDIAKRNKRPAWAGERRWRLYIRDLMLEGKFYDHLPYAFHEEESSGRQIIPLRDRRPSVIYNLAYEISADMARKLFARRHFPHFVHPDGEETPAAATALIAEGGLRLALIKAALWGSSGSVAITFRILAAGDAVRIAFNVHRGGNCIPTFDGVGELINLREQYLAAGANLMAIGLERDIEGEKIDPEKEYWFIRDYGRDEEVTYLPVVKDKLEEVEQLRPVVDQPDDIWWWKHDFGFVPGQWIRNLAGGEGPDGACTWWPAKEICVEIDYTLSQTGRGLRYNGAPQVVTTGDLKNIEFTESGVGRYVRGPASIWEGEPETKNPNGQSRGAFDAKLLEMKGDGLKISMDYVEKLDKYARRVIAASRKDPDKLVVPQSGKAMELLETEDLDLLDELRTSYGDEGLLPLARKAMRAAAKMGHPLLDGIDIDGLGLLALQWPKPIQPSAQELLALAQALALLVTPPGGNGGTARPTQAAGAAADDEGAGARPAPAAPNGGEAILTIDEARHLVKAWVDIPPRGLSLPEHDDPEARVTPAAAPEQIQGTGDGNPEAGNITEPHPVGATVAIINTAD